MINRRDFLKSTGLAFAFMALRPIQHLAAQQGKTSRPRCNVIVLLVDDLGYECLGVNGSRAFRTPAVDHLAMQGARFEQAFAQPNCTPTRVALMTGKVNARNYIHFGMLEESQRTFGHLFRDAGYATAVVGKWQLGGSVAEETPKHFGFDEHCLYHIKGVPRNRTDVGSEYASRYINPGLVINGEARLFDGNAYAPDLCNDFVLDWLGRHRDQPFFLYYPMMLTHAPFDPTPDSSDFPGKGGPKRTREQHYADMVNYNDKLIGKLVGKLDDLRLRERTLIVFFGDNGTPGNFVTEMADGEIVKAGKGSTIRAGMHVPLVVNQPGVITAGRVCSDLVNVTDILPTICEAAGISLPSDFVTDGQSFMPQLLGERGQPREWIYSWFNPLMRKDSETVEMAFTRDFKLYQSGEFYDWRSDPDEQHPLEAASLTGEAAAAARILQAALNKYRDARPAGIEARARALRDTTESSSESSASQVNRKTRRQQKRSR